MSIKITIFAASFDFFKSITLYKFDYKDFY